MDKLGLWPSKYDLAQSVYLLDLFFSLLLYIFPIWCGIKINFLINLIKIDEIFV